MSFDLINTLPNREIETHACVASAALIDSGGTYLGAQMIDTAIREVTDKPGPWARPVSRSRTPDLLIRRVTASSGCPITRSYSAGISSTSTAC